MTTTLSIAVPAAPTTLLAPERLRSDNVTPPTRTPWGGRRIAAHYKTGLPAALRDAPIGEAWEVSVEPSFPSRLARSGELLSDAIACDPVGWLGPAVAARYGGRLPLLVKLLDAAENLSVQVHPAGDDPDLGPGESGKPEAWIIVDAAPGAGLYLGLRSGVTRADVASTLAGGGALDTLLNFVAVEPGDVFVVDAGTIHAIGAGVTLIEPQHVWPGRRGVTYRLWDWNRRYDGAGRIDPAGRPRALHVERALAVVDWEAPLGAAFVARCRSIPRPVDGDGLRRTCLVHAPWTTAERWTGDGAATVDVDALLAVVCIGGALSIETAAGAIDLACGESAVVPAASGRAGVFGRAADAVVCWAKS